MVVDFGFWINVAMGHLHGGGFWGLFWRALYLAYICDDWLLMIILFIGVTGGLALPSDEAWRAETPPEIPGLLRLQHCYSWQHFVVVIGQQQPSSCRFTRGALAPK